MAKKRKPGAGRKPQGDFHGKSAVITTRITPQTRTALERGAARSGRSLSQEIEVRLNFSIRKGRTIDSPHVGALGEAVMLLARYIERATGEHWNENAFTGEALRQGCKSLIAHFAPRGTPVTPQLIKEAAIRLAQDIERVTGVKQTEPAIPDAASVGETQAGKVISMIESWGYREPEEMEESAKSAGAHFPREWVTHAQIFRDLGSGWKRAQKR